jgi:hypothetical protein
VVSGQSLSWTASGNGKLMTAPAGGVEQVIEGASIAGGTYTINWTGTATCTINSTTYAKGATVTLAANTNATLRLTGGTYDEVQLEPGEVATAFEARPIGMELALCQRYWQKITNIVHTGYQSGASGFRQFVPFPVMRATPTITLDLLDALNASGLTALLPGTSGFSLQVQATTTGPISVTADATLSSEL